MIATVALSVMQCSLQNHQLPHAVETLTLLTQLTQQHGQGEKECWNNKTPPSL